MIFECPKCKDLIDADPELAGTKGNCPHCRAKVFVPRPNLVQPAPTTQRSAPVAQSPNPSPRSSANTIFVIIFCVVILYVCRDNGLVNNVWSMIRLVVPEIVPEGAGYLGKEADDYKDGRSAGHLKGSQYTILFLSDGTVPTQRQIDYLSQQGNRSQAWHEGYLKGFNEGFKP